MVSVAAAEDVEPGAVKIAVADGPPIPALSIEPVPLFPGAEAIARGPELGTRKGAVLRIGGRMIEGLTWQDDCILFQVPDMPAGAHPITLHHKDAMSAPTMVQVL